MSSEDGKGYGDFMDRGTSGYSDSKEGEDAVNPFAEYDSEQFEELYEWRDKWYDEIRDMYENDRSPIWGFIRNARVDELLRAVMMLERISKEMDNSLSSIRNLEHTSEFQRRYSLPLEFKRHASDVKSLLNDGEIEGAKKRVDDMISDFNKYRNNAISTTSMVVTEATKFAYLVDGIQYAESLIKDVRHTLKDDNALLLGSDDYVDVAEIVYDTLVDKLLEENDDLVVPRDIGNIRDELKESLGDIKNQESYKNISWKNSMDNILEKYVEEEVAKDKSQLEEDEIRDLIKMFGMDTVERFLEGVNVDIKVGDSDD